VFRRTDINSSRHLSTCKSQARSSGNRSYIFSGSFGNGGTMVPVGKPPPTRSPAALGLSAATHAESYPTKALSIRNLYRYSAACLRRCWPHFVLTFDERSGETCFGGPTACSRRWWKVGGRGRARARLRKGCLRAESVRCTTLRCKHAATLRLQSGWMTKPQWGASVTCPQKRSFRRRRAGSTTRPEDLAVGLDMQSVNDNSS